MNTQIRIEVAKGDDAEQRTWLTLTVTKRSDGVISHDMAIRRALAADGADDGLPPSHCQVLKAEITAGVLTGLRKAGPGWHIQLERLGGSTGDDDASISTLPSIGWAVAATLAVLHGTGLEDLEDKPHGGHGWDLVSIDTMSF